MLNQRWLRAFGISIPIITAIVLFGIGAETNTNLFSTGVTVGLLLGIGNLFIAYCVWKNKI